MNFVCVFFSDVEYWHLQCEKLGIKLNLYTENKTSLTKEEKL